MGKESKGQTGERAQEESRRLSAQLRRGPVFALLQRLYEKPQDSWGIEEHRCLGLLYAVMALGTMYNIDENPGNPTTHQAAMEEG